MFSQRLRQLGLDKHFSLHGQDFQRAMGADLRRLVFQYIKGELTDTIPDGPAVKRFRDTAREIGGLDQFIAKQQPDKAWMTDIELTLLAEIFEVILVVEFASNKKSTVLYAVKDEEGEQPTVSLLNTNSTHWDAIIAGKKDESTIHDGNCGPHSFARGIEVLGRAVLPKTEASANVSAASDDLQTFESQNSRYTRSVEVYRKEQQEFDDYLSNLANNDPEKFIKVKKQIDSDYQYALKLALSDLPGVQGKASQATAEAYQRPRVGR